MTTTNGNLLTVASQCEPLWRYGLFSVDSEILVSSKIQVTDSELNIAQHPIPLDDFDRVIVVGAGKAGAGMARGLLQSLERLRSIKSIEGIVNVPDDCVDQLTDVELNGGRPAGVNEPTAKGEAGARRMLELVESAGKRDIVICLISGGGSALAPLPVDGISLEEKKNITRFLSRSGANINELNAVRSAISKIKAGGLVHHFQGRSLHSLIISDVLGNPLSVIASGMTVPQLPDLQAAIEVLNKFDPEKQHGSAAIRETINHRLKHLSSSDFSNEKPIYNHIIGDNSTVVDAVAQMAKRIGGQVTSESADQSEGAVESVAERLWQQFLPHLRNENPVRPIYLVSGGEPTVQITNPHGKGGRNQHLTLLILEKLLKSELPDKLDFEFVSLGTDGEDGPTDAAGAFVNATVLKNARELGLAPAKYLSENNAYQFFERAGGLIRTGPTHTNVCDLRIFSVGDQAAELNL